MKKKTGFNMEVKPIAVVSINSGAVDAMVKCDVLGTVLCRATKVGFMEYEMEVWEIENTNPLHGFTKAGLESFNKGVQEICLDMIRHCSTYPELWAVVRQDTEYDVWMLKKDMDDELKSMSHGLVSRFPLFKQYDN